MHCHRSKLIVATIFYRRRQNKKQDETGRIFDFCPFLDLWTFGAFWRRQTFWPLERQQADAGPAVGDLVAACVSRSS